MTDWIYCATQQQVDAEHTQQLLIERGAIWCQPPGLRPWPQGSGPVPAERLWLVWRHGEEPGLSLLGAGRFVESPRPGERFGTAVLWTNADQPGLREEAMDLGYTGPLNMAFLMLAPRVLPDGGRPQEIEEIDHLGNNLNIASGEDVGMLDALLHIP